MSGKDQSPPPGSFAKLMATRPKTAVAERSPTRRKKESDQKGKIERKKESLQESKKERFLSFVQPFLALKSSSTVSFRYPADLLDKLEEVQYRIKKRYGKKLTKNSILVAALAFIIWDLEANGKKSFLYWQLVEERG